MRRRRCRARRDRLGFPHPSPPSPRLSRRRRRLNRERAPVQEIVPAGELKRLQDSADALKREVRQWLEQTRVRRLDRRERGVMDNVESFLKLSDQAEAKGDMRQAYELAERAWVLAKDLHGGR